MGEYDRALTLIARRVSSNDAVFFHFLWSPQGRVIRAKPEFAAFVKKSGLTDLWDKYGAPDVCRRKGAGEYVCD